MRRAMFSAETQGLQCSAAKLAALIVAARRPPGPAPRAVGVGAGGGGDSDGGGGRVEHRSVHLYLFLLTVGGEQLADVVLDVAAPAASAAFLLLNHLLAQLRRGGVMLALLYLAAVLALLWRVTLLPLANLRLAATDSEARM